MSRNTINIAIGLFLLSALMSVESKGQNADFSGYRIFINPGHGGHDSDDRHMLPADFWESDGNLEKGLFLRQLMINLKATTFMSRTANTTADDLPLSSISAMANSANVDFFLSIHSNGYNGTQNQPLMLFRGYDDQPAFPEAKIIAGILWQKLFEKGNCWTSSSVWVKGDLTFYPEWGMQGLGVLRGLTMPGVLSEGSFHDYVPESWRLRNSDFLHHESWAFVRALAEHENVIPVNHGLIAGVVRDSMKVPSWYFKPGTRDEKMPLNNVDVTLIPGNKVYHVDNLNNGFFMFDSLAPGPYKLLFSGLPDYYKDSLTVNVAANKTTFGDIWMKYDTTIVPSVTAITPAVSDSVMLNQEFTFEFSLPMNTDSVQKAFSSAPSPGYAYTWNATNTILKISPLTQYSPKTNYIITISARACSKWKTRMAEPIALNFITKNRTRLLLEKSFPPSGKTGVSLFPQIRLYFDAPLVQSLLSSKILFTDDQGLTVSRVQETYMEADGKSSYFFQPASVLQLNKTYKIILDKDLADAGGYKLNNDIVLTFTARSEPYNSGSLIESFDDAGLFWDPDASGSTVGTNSELTTFSSSLNIKRGGTASGRLDYVFINEDGGLCRTFDTNKPVVPDDPSKEFGIWVFGDLSFNILEYWFYSSGSTNQIVYVDTIDWAGWEFKSIPVSSIGGSGDRNFHSTVIRQTENGALSGTIYFDQAQLVYPTGIPDILENDDIRFRLYPNPVSAAGRIGFTLREKSNVKLDIISLTGNQVQNISSSTLGPGDYIFDWQPGGYLADGLYLVRLETTKAGASAPKVYIRKCVLVR